MRAAEPDFEHVAARTDELGADRGRRAEARWSRSGPAGPSSEVECRDRSREAGTDRHSGSSCAPDQLSLLRPRARPDSAPRGASAASSWRMRQASIAAFRTVKTTATVTLAEDERQDGDLAGDDEIVGMAHEAIGALAHQRRAFERDDARRPVGSERREHPDPRHLQHDEDAEQEPIDRRDRRAAAATIATSQAACSSTING